MTNKGFAGFPPTADAVPDGSITAGKLASPQAFGRLTSGYYYFTASHGANSTSSTLGVGTLRLAPWFVPNACTLSRIGAEVTTTGDSGSKVRLGLYADAGLGYPGNLALDAGTIAGDSNTVQEITINQALTAGLYWVGGAVQVVTTTQPTIRTPSGIGLVDMNLLLASTPASGSSHGGFQQTSVTGALPAVFTSTVTTSGPSSFVRVFVKVA